MRPLLHTEHYPSVRLSKHNLQQSSFVKTLDPKQKQSSSGNSSGSKKAKEGKKKRDKRKKAQKSALVNNQSTSLEPPMEGKEKKQKNPADQQSSSTSDESEQVRPFPKKGLDMSKAVSNDEEAKDRKDNLTLKLPDYKNTLQSILGPLNATQMANGLPPLMTHAPTLEPVEQEAALDFNKAFLFDSDPAEEVMKEGFTGKVNPDTDNDSLADQIVQVPVPIVQTVNTVPTHVGLPKLSSAASTSQTKRKDPYEELEIKQFDYSNFNVPLVPPGTVNLDMMESLALSESQQYVRSPKSTDIRIMNKDIGLNQEQAPAPPAPKAPPYDRKLKPLYSSATQPQNLNTVPLDSFIGKLEEIKAEIRQSAQRQEMIHANIASAIQQIGVKLATHDTAIEDISEMVGKNSADIDKIWDAQDSMSKKFGMLYRNMEVIDKQVKILSDLSMKSLGQPAQQSATPAPKLVASLHPSLQQPSGSATRANIPSNPLSHYESLKKRMGARQCEPERITEKIGHRVMTEDDFRIVYLRIFNSGCPALIELTVNFSGRDMDFQLMRRMYANKMSGELSEKDPTVDDLKAFKEYIDKAQKS